MAKLTKTTIIPRQQRQPKQPKHKTCRINKKSTDWKTMRKIWNDSASRQTLRYEVLPNGKSTLLLEDRSSNLIKSNQYNSFIHLFVLFVLFHLFNLIQYNSFKISVSHSFNHSLFFLSWFSFYSIQYKSIIHSFIHSFYHQAFPFIQ